MAQSKKSSRRNVSAGAPSAADDAAGAAPVSETPVSEVAVQVAAQPVIDSTVQAAATTASAAHSSVLQLGSSLTIREVGECAAQIKNMLAAGLTDVDAGQLESIDTAGMQLLLAASVAAQRRGLSLRLLNAQGVKIGAARSLGLTEHLVELAEIVP